MVALQTFKRQTVAWTLFASFIVVWLWLMTSTPTQYDERSMEATLVSESSPTVDADRCLVDKCIELNRCLSDFEQIHVYVQPLVKVREPVSDVDEFFKLHTGCDLQNGENVNLPFSFEFTQIRDAIEQSEFATADAHRACFVVPGVDTLNLGRFRSESLAQRLVASAASVLPADSNLLLFNQLASRPEASPFSTRHVWASAALASDTLRRRFDVSLPLLRPYALGEQRQQSASFHAAQWTIIVRFASARVYEQLRAAMRTAPANVSIVFLLETAKTEQNMNAMRDQNAESRNYAVELSVRSENAPASRAKSNLQRSSFTIIHDLVPGYQMAILDAMEKASVPVIVSDDCVLPFHEALDWSQMALLVPKQQLNALPRILSSLSSEREREMRERASATFNAHLADARKMALTTLRLLEQRILSVERATPLDETRARVWSDAPIRSTSLSVSAIVALEPSAAALRVALRVIESGIPIAALASVHVLWPRAQRPHNLNAAIADVAVSKVKIRLLDWAADEMQKRLVEFAAEMRQRKSVSRDCWLFLDLRSRVGDDDELRARLTKSLFNQAFAAWKENADAILTFAPNVKNAGNNPSASAPPFFAGAAFVHPLAFAQTPAAANFSLCSQILYTQNSCLALTHHECSAVDLHLCRADAF